MIHPQTLPGRRGLLLVGAAVSLQAALAGCASPSAGTARPDVDSDAGRLRALLLMRGALDERLVIGYLTGRYFGVVDTEATPLFGVSSATFTRFRRLPDGSVLMASYERAYYTDLDTGRWLQEWTNPYTNERGVVPVWQSKPAKQILSPGLDLHGAAGLPPGLKLETTFPKALIQGDDLVMAEQVRSSIALPPPAKPYRYSEITSMRAKLADLTDPSAMRVPCTTSYTSISSWRPWQRMGDHPGHLVAHGVGRYGAEVAQIPEAWLADTRKTAPELLRDPGAPLDALWES